MSPIRDLLELPRTSQNFLELFEMADEWICVNPADFNPECLVVKPPSTVEIKTGNGTIKMTTSEIKYLDGDVEKRLCIPAPPQMGFGVSYNHEMDVPKDKQTASNSTGLQIQYQLTSLSTLNSPTPDEQAFISAMESVNEITIQHIQEQVDSCDGKEHDEMPIPMVSYNAGLAAQKSGNWSRVIKPWSEHPFDEKKKPDTTKPRRMYIKVKTSGKGDKLKSLAKFYGDGEQQISPFEIINKKGIIQPLIEIEGIYWGQHGNNKPYGASIRMKIIEATFIPKEGGSSVPSNRILPALSSSTVKRVDEEEQDEEAFSQPKSNKLTSAAKANTKIAVVPKAKAVAAPKAKAVASPAPAKAKVVASPAPKAKAKAKAVTASAPAPAPKAKVVKKPPPPPVEDEVEEGEDVEEDEVWDE